MFQGRAVSFREGTPLKTDMTLENAHFQQEIQLIHLHSGSIFQPAMLVDPRVFSQIFLRTGLCVDLPVLIEKVSVGTPIWLFL